jgi:DNA replication protein DnaC
MKKSSKTPEEIIELCKSLRLPSFIDYQDIINHNNSFEDNLLSLLTAERQRRLGDRLTRRLRAASFPFVQTIDNFEMTKKTLPYVNFDVVRNDLLSCNFIRKHEDLIILGPSGRGKSHLAGAIGYEASNQGFTVLYKQADILIAEITDAKANNKIIEYQNKLKKIDLLIIDEFCNDFYDHKESSNISQVIINRHEVKSTIVISNENFTEWGKYIKNEAIVTKIVDRLAYRSTILNMNSDISYRLSHSKNKIHK